MGDMPEPGVAALQKRVEDLEYALGAFVGIAGHQDRVIGVPLLVRLHRQWREAHDSQLRERELAKARKTIERLEAGR